jgi:hypothetical protein
VYPKVSGLRHNEINNKNKHMLRSNTKGYEAKLARLTHKIAAENCVPLAVLAPEGQSGNFWIHPRM